MTRFTHIDDNGRAFMVDVGEKPISKRRAKAAGKIIMEAAALKAVENNSVEKGDVLAVARIAGIAAAKETSAMIPLCHNIPLSSVSVDFRLDREEGAVIIEAEARAEWKTGVEMEALSAVSAAALTIYDMCKAIDPAMTISDIHLIEKEKS